MLFGKKKDESKIPACACQNGCLVAEASVPEEKITSIKVLGSGCKSCRQLFENAKEAVNSKRLSIEVQYITDLQKVMEYGVMTTPALVINEKVVSMGRVLGKTDIEKLI